MSHVDGVSLEPLFDLDGGDDEALVAERIPNAAATMAALHALDPSTLGLGDEPRVGSGDEVDRWCALLDTVDPVLAPGWESVAALPGPGAAGAPRRRRPRRLPARQPARGGARRHRRHRLGDLVDRRSAGRRRLVPRERRSATYRPRRATRVAAVTRTSSPTLRRALGHDAPDLEWFEALACFKSVATWALIVKHNRRRADPTPPSRSWPALPHLLERAEEHLGQAGDLSNSAVATTLELDISRPGSLLLRLNRPDRLNAINEALLRRADRHVGGHRVDRSVRVVVLTGAGRGFCAGIDVRDFGPSMPDGPDPAIDRLRFQE